MEATPPSTVLAIGVQPCGSWSIARNVCELAELSGHLIQILIRGRKPLLEEHMFTSRRRCGEFRRHKIRVADARPSRLLRSARSQSSEGIHRQSAAHLKRSTVD
jgi:hypothetical protein